jgi:hypothetical protein
MTHECIADVPPLGSKRRRNLLHGPPLNMMRLA